MLRSVGGIGSLLGFSIKVCSSRQQGVLLSSGSWQSSVLQDRSWRNIAGPVGPDIAANGMYRTPICERFEIPSLTRECKAEPDAGACRPRRLFLVGKAIENASDWSARTPPTQLNRKVKVPSLLT